MARTLRTFPCPSNDNSTCYYGKSMAVVRREGEFRLMTKRDVDALEAEMEIALARAQPIKLDLQDVFEGEGDEADPEHVVASIRRAFAESDSEPLRGEDGVIVVCRPCNETWIVPLP